LAKQENILSVEQEKVIDVIGFDKNTGYVVLTISDHLDWRDSVNHQLTLQRKFNSYLAFVESREIFERYPSARDRLVTFRVFFKYRPDADGERFLDRAKQVIEEAGFNLIWEIFAER
jgi:hypothetical protein